MKKSWEFLLHEVIEVFTLVKIFGIKKAQLKNIILRMSPVSRKTIGHVSRY